MTATITADTTPIFDELVSTLGDPVVSPAVDRSYRTLSEEATRREGKDQKPSPVASKLRPSAKRTTKSDQDKES